MAFHHLNNATQRATDGNIFWQRLHTSPNDTPTLLAEKDLDVGYLVEPCCVPFGMTLLPGFQRAVWHENSSASLGRVRNGRRDIQVKFTGIVQPPAAINWLQHFAVCFLSLIHI